MSMGVVGTFSSCVGFVPGDLRDTVGGLEEGAGGSGFVGDEELDFARWVNLQGRPWHTEDGNWRVLSKRYVR